MEQFKTFQKEYPDYIECDECGYRKYCKLQNSRFICQSCDRIAKEKKNANKGIQAPLRMVRRFPSEGERSTRSAVGSRHVYHNMHRASGAVHLRVLSRRIGTQNESQEQTKIRVQSDDRTGRTSDQASEFLAGIPEALRKGRRDEGLLATGKAPRRRRDTRREARIHPEDDEATRF